MANDWQVMREAFEEWMRLATAHWVTEPSLERDGVGGYVDPVVDGRWFGFVGGWQSAQEAADE